MRAIESIEIGDQVYLVEGGEPCGAVRGRQGDGIVIYVENGGDFPVTAKMIAAAHDHKVILSVNQLPAPVKRAIAHAHDKETELDDRGFVEEEQLTPTGTADVATHRGW